MVVRVVAVWLFYLAMFFAPQLLRAQTVESSHSAPAAEDLPDAPLPQIPISAPQEPAAAVADSVMNQGPPPPPTPTVKAAVELGMKAQPPCRPAGTRCGLSAKEKFELFVHRTYSPYTFFGAALDAGYSRLTHDTSYGAGTTAFGKEFGALLVSGETRSFFQTFLLSTALKQDPRYHRLGQGSVLYRMAYAASRVLIGRTDYGRSAVNVPEVLGTGITVAISNTYCPPSQRGWDNGASRVIGSIGSDAGSNVLREFWPDISRALRRKEPKSLKSLEHKVTGIPLALLPDAVAPAPKKGEQPPSESEF